MSQGPLHNRGADGRCQACGEVFPCRTTDRELVQRHNQDESDRLLGALRDLGQTEVVPSLTTSWPQHRKRLVRALGDAAARPYMIQSASGGRYDGFRSTQVPRHEENLISHAERLGLWDIARRARAGEFDAP